MKHLSAILMFAALIVACTIGCDTTDNAVSNVASPDDPDRELAQCLSLPNLQAPPGPPAGQVSVTFGNRSLEFWPWTGTNFSGSPQDQIGRASCRERV